MRKALFCTFFQNDPQINTYAKLEIIAICDISTDLEHICDQQGLSYNILMLQYYIFNTIIDTYDNQPKEDNLS